MANVAIYGKESSGTPGRHRVVTSSDTVTDSSNNPAIASGTDVITSYNLTFGNDSLAGIVYTANGAAQEVASAFEAAAPIAGTVDGLSFTIETPNTTGGLLDITINDVDDGSVSPKNAHQASFGGLNQSISAADRIEVDPDYNSNKCLLHLLIEPTTEAEQGYVLPFGGNLNLPGNFANSCGSSASTTGTNTFDTTIIVPQSGNIEVVGFNKSNSSDATMQFWLNGSTAGSSFATGTAAANGVVTSVSIAVTAGDRLQLEFDSGSNPNSSIWTVHIEPTDGGGGHVYMFGGDVAADQNLVANGHPAIAFSSQDPDLRHTIARGGRIKGVGVYRETTSSAAIYTVNVNDRIQIPLSIAASTANAFANPNEEVFAGEWIEVLQDTDSDNTSFIVFVQ